jgi:hypothetical protein
MLSDLQSLNRQLALQGKPDEGSLVRWLQITDEMLGLANQLDIDGHAQVFRVSRNESGLRTANKHIRQQLLELREAKALLASVKPDVKALPVSVNATKALSDKLAEMKPLKPIELPAEVLRQMKPASKGVWITFGAIVLIITGIVIASIWVNHIHQVSPYATTYHPTDKQIAETAPTPLPTATSMPRVVNTGMGQVPQPTSKPTATPRATPAATLVVAMGPIIYTTYTDGKVRPEGYRAWDIVITKADNTEQRLRQLGVQLDELTAGDHWTSINVYTDAWSAKHRLGSSKLPKAQQLRYNKAWVAQYTRGASGKRSMYYAPGGLYTGWGENVDYSPEGKVMDIPSGKITKAEDL